MSVEVFHEAPYVVESSATNPDFAVFFRHHAAYMLLASVANPEFSIFMQEQKFYEISGSKRPNEWTVNIIKLYEVIAPSAGGDRPKAQELTVYGLFGGTRSLAPRIEQGHFRAYEVFTT